MAACREINGLCHIHQGATMATTISHLIQEHKSKQLDPHWSEFCSSDCLVCLLFLFWFSMCLWSIQLLVFFYFWSFGTFFFFWSFEIFSLESFGQSFELLFFILLVGQSFMLAPTLSCHWCWQACSSHHQIVV